MTRIAGSVDFIGASGGLISRGDLYLYARNTDGPGNWYGSGINADLQVKNNLVLQSKNLIQNVSPIIRLNSSDSIFLDVINVFDIGHNDFTNDTPGAIDLYALNTINILTGQPGPVDSNGIIIDGGNTVITTLGSQRPTINTSGIALVSEVPVMAEFYGRPDGDQDLQSSFTEIPWDSIVKNNITHTDGEDEVYLPNIGIYFINCFLTTDFDIGGHVIQIRLEHYNGFTTQIKVIRPGPTTCSNRNSIDVAYTVQTLTVNDYIRVRAQCSADTLPDGVVWKFDQSGLNIVKM